MPSGATRRPPRQSRPVRVRTKGSDGSRVPSSAGLRAGPAVRAGHVRRRAVAEDDDDLARMRAARGLAQKRTEHRPERHGDHRQEQPRGVDLLQVHGPGQKACPRNRREARMGHPDRRRPRGAVPHRGEGAFRRHDGKDQRRRRDQKARQAPEQDFQHRSVTRRRRGIRARSEHSELELS